MPLGIRHLYNQSCMDGPFGTQDLSKNIGCLLCCGQDSNCFCFSFSTLTDVLLICGKLCFVDEILSMFRLCRSKQSM